MDSMDTQPEANSTPLGSDAPQSEPTLVADDSKQSWTRITTPSICGVLSLDRHEVSVGESVQVEWRIDSVGAGSHPVPVPSERDWIGLFQAGKYMYAYIIHVYVSVCIYIYMYICINHFMFVGRYQGLHQNELTKAQAIEMRGGS